MLKTRSSPYKSIVIGSCIDTFQVLYRTTDSNYNASWAVTTVFIPATHAGCSTSNSANCSRNLVSYAIIEDSASPDAAPSWTLQFGEGYGDIYELLSRGWFVNVPDYEGPKASYTAGVQAGLATLDSTRAVLQVAGQWGLQANPRVALWGYSGGALATEFAAEFAGSYAPELALAGIAHGGLVPNATDAGNKLDGTGGTGLIIAGLIGLTSQHAEARQYLNSRLKTDGPYNATRFYTAQNMSLNEVLYAFQNENITDYFVNGLADLGNPVLVDIYNTDATSGVHGVPKMPVFLYKAVRDQMDPGPDLDSMVNNFCSQGANILYHRNVVGGHNQELWSGRPRALQYLEAVLDGKIQMDIPKSGCQTINVSIACFVDVEPKLVMEGTQKVNYSALTVYPFNITSFPNGSMLWPTENGTVLITPAPDKRRSEHLDFSGLVGRWSSSLKSAIFKASYERTRQRSNPVRNRLDLL